MTNPWDRPPILVSGDRNINDTYSAVGRLLSQWEEIELELSHFYSCSVGKPHNREALREYGGGKIFADRIRRLQESADRYFCRRPNQTEEAELSELARSTVSFSARRNDIAHGIVNAMSVRFEPDRRRGDMEVNRRCVRAVPAKL